MNLAGLLVEAGQIRLSAGQNGRSRLRQQRVPLVDGRSERAVRTALQLAQEAVALVEGAGVALQGVKIGRLQLGNFHVEEAAGAVLDEPQILRRKKNGVNLAHQFPDALDRLAVNGDFLFFRFAWKQSHADLARPVETAHVRLNVCFALAPADELAVAAGAMRAADAAKMHGLHQVRFALRVFAVKDGNARRGADVRLLVIAEGTQAQSFDAHLRLTPRTREPAAPGRGSCRPRRGRTGRG